ncbi:MAG TPA: PP2C family protein-serine/threonine phosphatase [Syntrophorhabdaceae bacterium]|nr:PP2C family protein-serine/threonine phosphatase [Syntrophorhabdaceae bacterium]
MQIKAGIKSDIGYRDKMEDEYAIYEREKIYFYSAEVYDGHNGKGAAVICSEMITPYFLHLISEEIVKEQPDFSRFPKFIRETCISVDEFIVNKGIEAGTTIANFYILKDRFFSANIGDSRIVIGTYNGCETLTEDHKPDLPKEKTRIEAAGGFVIKFGVHRVQGELAMSRAIGDSHLKPYVIAEPFVVNGFLGKENDFVVVACDGIWDVLSADEAIDIARKTKEAQKAADTILSTATFRGSTDNKTVIVLDLRYYEEKNHHERFMITHKKDFAIDS